MAARDRWQPAARRSAAANSSRAGLLSQWLGGFPAAPDFRRVDAHQPNLIAIFKVQGIAVDHPGDALERN